MGDIEERLRKRGTESEESLNLRLKNATNEVERGLKENDDSCLIGYRLVNKNLEDA